MPDRDSCFLNLFLCETGRDADLESRLEFPILVFTTAWSDGHTLETGDENAVCESL